VWKLGGIALLWVAALRARAMNIKKVKFASAWRELHPAQCPPEGVASATVREWRGGAA